MKPLVKRVFTSLALSLLILASVPLALAQWEGNSTDPGLRTTMNTRPKKVEAAPKYVVVELPDKKLLQFYPELKGLEPAQTQQDLPKLLEQAGANEVVLVNNVPDVISQEDVVQEQLDRKGLVHGLPMLTGRYRFLVLAHAKGAPIRLSEYRTIAKGKEAESHPVDDSFLGQNFALMPLYFHPVHQDAAKFRYLGRQLVDQQNDYVIAFAQQPERAQLKGFVTVGGAPVEVAYQGIAWIEPEHYQIVRIRTDLLQTTFAAGTQQTDIQFGEVHLPTVASSLWLPREAVITRMVGGNGVREKHVFSDYKRAADEYGTPAAPQAADKPK